MNVVRIGLLVAILAGAFAAVARPAAATEPSPRERLSADAGWRFHLGDEWGIGQNLAKAGTGRGPASTDYGDASWRPVDLPHDWAVELPFDPNADGAHGFKPLGEGFPQNSIGWYRRTFELPPGDAGRRLWLEFDGVFRDSTVFVNGWYVGRQESGYGSFRYDITDVANYGGKNVVAVRVDASQFEGWFYEGAGIYRHAWLVKTSPLAIAPDGVFVSSRFENNVPGGPAELHLQTRLTNAARSTREAIVTWTVVAPDGTTLATAQRSGAVGAGGAIDVEQTARVARPELWAPEAPRLYTLVTEVRSAGKTVDRIDTKFGIRTVAFDPDRGFLLNGKPYVLKGTCNHQDHAGLGAALPDSVQSFRIVKLKEMGSNAYRTAHNPPTPELLEACDRLGMLVMDENRLLGSDPAHLRGLEDMVRRDRNHPSVVVWSLGNEEFSVEGNEEGGRVAAAMQDAVLRIDPTRPVTYNAPMGNEFAGINSVIGVRGWSYHIGAATMDAYHSAHPKQPNVGSEQGSTVSTRGIYFDDPRRGYVSAYDDHAQSWSNTAQEWWSFFDPRPWLSGGFVWTGFDYRGEPTPYGWPCINSHFGIFDTAGFPKDNFWYYQSWWTDRPVLHLLPHWNWSGAEGREMDVRASSNTDEVELFLNGRSLGRQRMARDSELRWKVAYVPGVLSARGFRAGRVVAEAKVETTGAPASIALAADRATLGADGRDAAVVAVSVADVQGRPVPTASDSIAFRLEGPGRIIGVGNGDPSSHEPDKYFSFPILDARGLDEWRWAKIANPYADHLPELAADFDDSRWAVAHARSAQGQIAASERAVFRHRFRLSAEELSASAVELWFGKIESGVAVYVNGKKLGTAGDAHGPWTLEAKPLLHVGENTVALTVACYGGSGGLSRGALLRFVHDAPSPQGWRRSLFSGLAEVLVQSSQSAGTIRLTAEAPGLEPATVSLIARAVEPLPALP